MTAREKILLERYRLGELPRNLVAQVESMDNLKEAMDELDRSDKEILEQYSFSTVERKIRRRKAQKMSRFATIAAALTLVIGGAFIFAGRNGAPSNGIRIKGNQANSPVLTLYRHQGDRVEQLSDGAMASSGDLLQIGYRNTSPNTFGLILSIDGNGQQTIHYPMSGDEALLLENGGEFYLPWSYELDDAPEYEAFFLLASDQPFSMKDISAAALLENRIPRSVEVHGLMLSKRE